MSEGRRGDRRVQHGRVAQWITRLPTEQKIPGGALDVKLFFKPLSDVATTIIPDRLTNLYSMNFELRKADLFRSTSFLFYGCSLVWH